jgi:hypothetical protein
MTRGKDAPLSGIAGITNITEPSVESRKEVLMLGSILIVWRGAVTTTSASSKRSYEHVVREFIEWFGWI